MPRRIFLSLSLIAIVLMGCDPRDGDITVYPVACDNNIVKESCRGTWQTLEPITLQVFSAQQFVVSGTANHLMGYKLSNCTVFDFRNWNCSDKSYSIPFLVETFRSSKDKDDFEYILYDIERIEMRKGKFAAFGKSGQIRMEDKMRFVSWWRWWLIKLL